MRVRMLLAAFCFPLACGSSNFDPEEARRFASLASVTYCDQVDVVQSWTCSACKDAKMKLAPGIQIIDAGTENATRTIVGKLQDQSGCLVAFRGTDNLVNQLKDLEFWAKNPTIYPHCDGCKVHAGFYTVWQNIHGPIIAALQRVGCAPDSNSLQNLYLTGHSMGGSVALLSMFTLENAGFKIQRTYTFESTRVGNQAFADAFSARFAQRVPVFRVTHHMDPIPHYPPLLFGYQHVPTEVYYNKKGEYKVCSGGEDDTCMDQFVDVPAMFALHLHEHCGSPLVPNGDICNPVGCVNARTVIV